MMTPRRPYMLRAMYDWLLDNQCTPHLLVDAEQQGVVVPTQYVESGQIVLNLSPTAVRGLELGDEFVSFSARFGGTPMQVTVPLSAVLAVYARENGQGMVFPEEYLSEEELEAADSEAMEAPQEQSPGEVAEVAQGKSQAEVQETAEKPRPSIQSVSGSAPKSAKPSEKKRPALRVVK